MKINNSISAGVRVYHAPLRVIRVPFNVNNVETNTNVYFDAGDVIEDCRIKVTTAVAGSSVDVGFDGTTHNDPDGLIDGATCAATGWPMVSDSSASASTMGGMLQEGAGGQATVATATGGPSRFLIMEDDCPLTYTTSDHACAGYIYIWYRSLDEGANA